LPVNDRVVVFDERATRRGAIQECQIAHGAVPDRVAARHWLTVEWPLSELQKSLPDAFPRSTAITGLPWDRATDAG
jgi:hypothetical protein